MADKSRTLYDVSVNVDEDSLLNEEAQELGWTGADIEQMWERGKEIGIEYSPIELADSLNKVAALENKDVEGIYSLAKEGNGEQIASLYAQNGFIQEESAQLTESSIKAGYNADHLIEQSKP